MDAAGGLLKRYFRVAAKPIALALLYYIIIAWLCSFFWFRLGDPAQIFVDPRMPPQVRMEQFEIVKNFSSLLNHILQWNFGRQLDQSSTPILPELSWRIRNTLMLIGFSTAASILAGALLTVIFSTRKPKKRRPVIFAHSLKCFLFGLTPFIAIILIYIFWFLLRLFPRGGLISVGISKMTPIEAAMDFLAHLVLPVLTITLVTAIRSAMLIWSGGSSLSQKSPWKIFLFSITTIDFAFMASAAFFVEIMYAFPGAGQWFMSSLGMHNHPVTIASFVALLAIAIGLGIMSSFLDLLQVSTGLRDDLENASLQHSKIETQPNKRSLTKSKFAAHFKRKSLIIGLTIFSFFAVLAVAAPLLTPSPPPSQLYSPPKSASAYAMPAWMTMFPEYRDYNPTLATTFRPEDVELVNYTGPIEVNLDNLTFSFNPDPDGFISQNASVTIFVGNITYDYRPPPSFTMHVSCNMYFNRTILRVYFTIKNYTANPLWDEYFKDPTKAEMLICQYTPWSVPIANITIDQKTFNLSVPSFIDVPWQPVLSSLYKPEKLITPPPDPATIIFSEKGVYGVQVMFEFENLMDPKTHSYEGAYAELNLEKVGLTIEGKVHGLLGTDGSGLDVWTELVYGARTIIVMSFAFSALTVLLALPFGVLAGRFKGWTDNIIMTAAETFFAVPVIFLLLISLRYQYTFYLESLSVLFWFLPVIAIIGFRTVYLTSLVHEKSRRDEAYALLKYSLANFCLTAISVSLILTSIDFLGFGDPNQASWGRILYGAYQLGGLPAWWVSIVPIGLVLLFITGLFLIGLSLDEA
ncbi:MAG: hypothetical protein OEY22_09750 [Candidatus Bathyarchaeota archaeon]|nr:hypothetical protein [Candidatus Bathyarchaeota archaeon]MDH5788271.1 hypothetical protein [Candidatus Bathyarchaeota archaeon]